MGAVRRRRFWLTVGAAGTVAALLIAFHFPESFFGRFRLTVDRGVTHEMQKLLRSQLGDQARLAAVDLSWNGLKVRGLELPLDSHGSLLRAQSAELGWSLRAFLRNPFDYGLAAKSLVVRSPELSLRLAAADSQSARGRWIGGAQLPEELFAIFARVDSLKSVEVSDGRVVLLQDSGAIEILRRFDGRIVRDERERFDFVLTGYHGATNDDRLTVSGRMDCTTRDFDFDAILLVPPGLLPYDDVLHLGVRSTGGHAKIRGWQSVDTTAVVAEVRLDSVRAVLGQQELVAPTLRANFARDTLRVAELDLEHRFAEARVSGFLACSGDGPLFLTAAICPRPELAELAQQHGVAFALTHTGADVTVSGTLREISGKYSVECDSVTTPLTTFDKIDLNGDLFTDRVTLERGAWKSAAGEGQASGLLKFGGATELQMHGFHRLDTVLSVAGLATRVKGLDIRLSGSVTTPQVQLCLLDSSHVGLLRAAITPIDQGWALELTSNSDSLLATGAYRIDERETSLTCRSVSQLASAIFADLPQAISAIGPATVRHQGDASGGFFATSFESIVDSGGLLSRIAQDLSFDGDYRRVRAGTLLTGRWRGVAGDGTHFSGRAEGLWSDRRFDLNHCYIDEVSQIAGFIDLKHDTLSFRTEIKELPYERFPIKTDALRRAKLSGVVSGQAELNGKLSNPRWKAAFTLVDGSILGIPGYWLNTEAHGTLDDIYLDRLELGRDRSKIFDVTGWADFRQKLVSLNAVATEARAEDFLGALFGRSNLMSGALAGSIKASGSLKSPNVVMELSATHGELLNEIWFDTLAAKVELDLDSLAGQTVRVPDFYFSKSRTYEFTGDLRAELRKGGAFTARLDGQGDFIDLLDQVDRTFIGYGSESSLAVEFGGSIDAPKFLGANLKVANGRFSYVDATPEPVSLNLEILVGAPGQVESGFIELATGTSQVNLQFLPESQAREKFGLEPLLIPHPNLNLGVLVISTGGEGIPVTLPGFMKKEWTGILTTGCEGRRPLTISANGPTRLLVTGDVDLREGRLTFPFFPMGAGVKRPVARWLYRRLYEARWDLALTVGAGNHYDVELTNLKDSDIFAPLRTSPVLSTLADYFDHLTIDALVDPTTDTLRIAGVVDSSTFYMVGNLTTRRGRVDYLDQTFQIDYAFSDFDGTNIMPVLEGRAYTFGVDSVGRRVPVYLTMYQVEPESQTRSIRGRLDEIVFVLEGAGGENSERALAYLGYQPEGVSGKAEQLVATTVARVIGREWIDPLERKLERWTALDEIALSPGGGRRTSLSRQYLLNTVREDSLLDLGVVRYFAGSQLSVGKYLSDDVFLSYTGELAESQAGIEGGRIGLVHFWNIEYRMEPISRDLVLDFAVEYDEMERRRDESVSLKYSFALEP